MLRHFFAIAAITLLAAVSVGDLRAQNLISTDPAIPILNQSLTVFFNAVGTDLQDYTGDVYTHTGVNLSDGRRWQYVIEAWGNNSTQPRLTREAANRYRLDIDDVYTFYSVPASETVTGLAFVFRSADATRQTIDLFIDLADPGLNVRIIQPDVSPLNPLIARVDTTIEVLVVGQTSTSPLDRIRLEINGSPVADVNGDTLRYDLHLNESGRVDVLAVAESVDGKADSSSFYAIRNPETILQNRPPGLEDGITYRGPSAATLSLFAPGKEYAYLIGDFSNWEVDTDFFMNREDFSTDSTWFWIDIEGLTAGEEVAFQYLVDGKIRVADPYSEKVLMSDDRFIPTSTYPDLKPYPENLTRHAVSVLHPGRPAFQWTDTDFEAPPQHELVIYELLFRDFLHASNFETLIDTLDYLERLGINAIELLPISEFDGNDSWGYNPAFHLALDKYYGTREAFKRFVDAAHGRGIAVILDVVYNHATGQSPLVRLWNEGDYGRPTPENPYANVTARHPFNVFNDLNHESAATQYWLDRANRYWLEEFNIDGFRFDLSKGFTQKNTGSNVGAWGAYDASRIRLLKRMADRVWDVKPDAYVILEHFAADNEERELAHHGVADGYPGMMLWNNVNYAFNEATMGYLAGSNFSHAYYGTTGQRWELPHLISYMESHDEQWLMLKNRKFGNAGPNNYRVPDLNVALDRMKLAGAFFFTTPGPKMMWQFGELGYGGGPEECLKNDGDGDCLSSDPGRTARKPIRWDYYEDPLRQKLYRTWAELLRLRRDHEVFRDSATVVEQSLGGAIKRITLSHEEMDVVIVGNFDVIDRETSVPFPHDGTWYDFFEGAQVDVTGGSVSRELLAGEFHVYTSSFVEPAEPGLITVNVDSQEGRPATFILEQNYPNPFNSITEIRFSLPQSEHARLEVFDALGRSLGVLVDTNLQAGNHSFRFDAAGIASGLYFYRLTSESNTQVRTMTVVK